MLQVMAQNHFEALAAKSGPNSRGQEACVNKEEQGPFLKSGFFFANTGMFDVIQMALSFQIFSSHLHRLLLARMPHRSQEEHTSSQMSVLHMA